MSKFIEYLNEADDRDNITKIVDMIAHDTTEENIRVVAFNKLIGILEKTYNKKIPKTYTSDLLKKINQKKMNENRRREILNDLIAEYKNSNKKSNNSDDNNSNKTSNNSDDNNSNNSNTIANIKVFDPTNLFKSVNEAKGVCICNRNGYVNKVRIINPTEMHISWYGVGDKGRCECYVFDNEGKIIAGIMHFENSQKYGKLGKVDGEHIAIIPASYTGEGDIY